SGTHTFDAASGINGANATVQLSATETVAGSYSAGQAIMSSGTATFTLGGSVTFPVLNFSGGTLTGTNTINIPGTGTLNWTGGVMAGTGATNGAAGATTTLRRRDT